MGRAAVSDAERVLWIDAGAGAAGDMLLGALVDVGVPLGRLRQGLAGLAIDGWALSSRRVERAGVRARKLRVRTRQEPRGRSFSRVARIVRSGGLAPPVRDRALQIFHRIFEAEAEVHGSAVERVHLHEMGDDDALIDVIGTCVALEHLAPRRIVVSPLTTGHGRVRCRHGLYPVPTPVTALLVRGVPVRGGEVEAELLTPTGAAILTSVADEWGALPAMIPVAVGHGAGDRDFADHPNVLRAILGNSTARGTKIDPEVTILELNVDDSTPQAIAFTVERALDTGALEAFVTPVQMKKGRPGQLLTVICRSADRERLGALLLRETSSLGLRYRGERRIELERSVVRVRTAWGAVRVKSAGTAETSKAWPEYDDCASLARRHGVALREVQRAALDAYHAKVRRKKTTPSP